MPVAHCVSSIAGTILVADANFCRLLQRSHDELIGASYRSITVSEDIPKSAQMLQHLVDKAAPTRLHKRYWRPDGSVVEVDLLVSKFADAGHLVSTLSWIDEECPLQSPLRMWKAALHIRHLYSLRIEELGRELFGDFAGLILLHLYLAEAEGRIASVPDIAAATGLSDGSLRRWIAALGQKGLVRPGTGIVQLSDEGWKKLERLIAAALQPALQPAL
jgi:PAS domain S-box-containing protein